MKKLLLVLLSFAIVCGCGKVELSDENNDNPYITDEPNIDPEDDIFLQFCIEKFDTDGDGTVSPVEADKVKSITCSGMEIVKLTDIDKFSNLEVLDCSGNKLVSLDLTKNRHIKSVNCKCNSLRTLSVAGCGELQTLDCSYNKLETLDLSRTVGIVTVNCKCNSLVALSVVGCKVLQTLDCSNNSLLSLGVFDCLKLSALDCTNNPSLKELIVYQDISNLDKDSHTEIKYSGLYNVGDKYSRNGKTGIVFYVTDNGLHGKIVSEDETYCQWSTEDVRTGATDNNDGMTNMKKIQAISGWHEKYPAFAWCADKGDGWYLPAFYELIAVLDELDVLEEEKYWSSTEADNNYWSACYVGFIIGGTYYYYKGSSGYVRAVYAF